MPAPRRSTTAALALVALFVSGQAALFAHQLLVPHQACAEHSGELIHVAAQRGVALSFDAPSFESAQRVEASHGHEHCGVFVTRREQAIAPPLLDRVAVDTPTSVRAPAVPQSRDTGRAALLRLAPKNSPPV